jgi:hypothetical protein
MAAARMSAAGLIVHVGATRSDAPEALSVGWHDEADVPFRPGDEFPFGDATVGAMTLGDFVEDLRFETQVHLLMECRRVLTSGGLIAVAPGSQIGPVTGSEANAAGATAQDAPGEASVAGICALVGLESANKRDGDAKPLVTLRHGGRVFTKPDRRVLGDPLVSIAIPAYNPRFLEASLDSAIGQTYDNVEIVVCDDSAGPEIERIVQHRAQRRPIRYERNPVRLWPRGNFVRCFSKADGEFVKFLCDDDLLAPTCVERLLDAFRRAPDITLATSHRLRIDAAGIRLGEQPATQPIVAGDSVLAGHTLANAVLMAGLNRIGEPSTAMFRKSDFAGQAPDYFRFRGTAGHGVIDMVMWTALLMKGNAVYLVDSLSAFRIHPEQRQHDPSKRQRNIDSIRSLQAEWLALKLFDHVPPHLLLAKSFPPGQSDWVLQPVLGVAARAIGDGVVGTAG